MKFARGDRVKNGYDVTGTVIAVTDDEPTNYPVGVEWDKKFGNNIGAGKIESISSFTLEGKYYTRGDDALLNIEKIEKQASKVVITNCDDDGFYEVIVYDEAGEKTFQTKVHNVHMELLPPGKK